MEILKNDFISLYMDFRVYKFLKLESTKFDFVRFNYI